MKSEKGYEKIRKWLDDHERKGFHLNGCCCIIIDNKAGVWSTCADIWKEPMARSLAALFLDDEVVWKAFKYANRLALQEKRKKTKEEVKDGRN